MHIDSIIITKQFRSHWNFKRFGGTVVRAHIHVGYFFLKSNEEIGSIPANTDDFYTPTFHKPLSLFGRSYTFRYRVLYLRNAIAVFCNKRTSDIWSENQATKRKCKGPKFW